MSFLRLITGLLTDPPPAMAFELSEAGVASARVGSKAEVSFRQLKPGTISISPVRDNVLLPDELLLAIRASASAGSGKKRRDAALILPDYCTRVTVLDFDSFPSDPKERLSLVRFRIRKSIPFDIDSAAVSYYAQPSGNKRFDVVVVVAPIEIVARYEGTFRTAGLNPGLITTSSLAALNLVENGTGSITVVAKVTGRVLTVMVLEEGLLKLVRCLELTASTVEEVASDLYPTFVFVEDSFGAKAGKLLLCGFGERTEEARGQFERELGIEVEVMRTATGLAGEYDAGLSGYLRSLGL